MEFTKCRRAGICDIHSIQIFNLVTRSTIGVSTHSNRGLIKLQSWSLHHHRVYNLVGRADGQSSIIHNGFSKDVIIPHLISMLAYAIKYDNFKLRWTLFILFLYKRLGWGSNSWHSYTTMETLFSHCSFQKAFLRARDRCLLESRPHFLAQYLIYSPLMTCLVERRKW